MSFASRERTQNVRRVIIHHTAGSTLSGALNALRDRGLSYHVIIDVDGTSQTLVPYDRVAFHAGNANDDSIGISLVGNMTTRQPYDAQIATLQKLLKEIFNSFEIMQVLGHSDVGPTQCPAFDVTPFQNMLLEWNKAQYEDTESPEHWAQLAFDQLLNRGVTIHETRFNDPMTRGETFSLLLNVLNALD